jgi:CBS domain containing-hemolysin-like protein
MTLLLIFLAFTLVFSFLCSVLEAVILTVPPSYVAAMKRVGRRTGHLLHRLKHDIDRPLAAILTLNTVANTAGAALVGNQARAVFESLWVGFTTGGLTFLVLVFSEIIPKTLGATYWRRLAMPAAWTTQGLIVALYPIVVFANRIAALIARDRPASRVSRGEIRAIADLGHSQGVIAADESRIIENVMKSGALAVRAAMTPRTVVVALDESLTLAEVPDADLRHSRIPIYRGSIDSVTGYVLRYELLLAVARGEGERTVESLRRDILPLPDTQSLRDAFARLLGRHEHIALIVDQYGGTAGIVTVEDIVETLLGLEIVDETDRATDMQELARRRWARRVRRQGLAVEGGASTAPPDEPTGGREGGESGEDAGKPGQL